MSINLTAPKILSDYPLEKISKVILNFEKYHGAGNDFILINSLNTNHILTSQQIKIMCDRHLGVGADGLMQLLPSSSFDFEMKYFNSDGFEGSMCGNGGRSILAFAYASGIIKNSASFKAIDGVHYGEILFSKDGIFKVLVSLNDVNSVEIDSNLYFLNTGSPHHVQFVDEFIDEDVVAEGKKIRFSERYASMNGTNVNFVKELSQGIFVRTYERGVENETLSCGTGVTASAIAYAIKNNLEGEISQKIITLGGELEVKFDLENFKAKNIKLIGPVTFVFNGKLEI